VRSDDQTKGMQIDLLIDRADDVVNVCEMKYSISEYSVTKAYADKLCQRIAALESAAPSKTFHLTLVSTNGLSRNEYSDIFTAVLTIDELFVF